MITESVPIIAETSTTAMYDSQNKLLNLLSVSGVSIMNHFYSIVI